MINLFGLKQNISRQKIFCEQRVLLIKSPKLNKAASPRYFVILLFGLMTKTGLEGKMGPGGMEGFRGRRGPGGS